MSEETTPSRADVIAAKYDEIEAAAPETAPEPVAEASPEPAPQEDAAPTAPDRSRDEHGRFAKAEKAPEPKPQVKSGAIGPELKDAPPLGKPAAEPPPSVKAPQSWKPTVRDLVSRLPAEFHPIVEEALRRDKETALAMQKAAEAGKGAQPMIEAIRPYEMQIRAAGIEPSKYVGDLLQTVHALTYGNPTQQADVLAAVVMQYGRHLLNPDGQDANGQPTSPLDRAIVSRLQGQGQPQRQTQPAYQDPRVDKLLQALQSQQQERLTQAEAASDARVEEFAGAHEFYEDVREQMADIVDLWAKQGKKSLSDEELERAYNLACNMNPDVSAVLERKKKAETVRTSQEATARARAASSSIRSQPAAAPPTQPTDRRSVLAARFDEIESQ